MQALRFALRPLSRSFILIWRHLKSSCHVWNAETAVNNKSRGWGILGCTLACGLSSQKNKDIQKIKRSGVPEVYKKWTSPIFQPRESYFGGRSTSILLWEDHTLIHWGMGRPGVLHWIRHEPFHITPIALRLFQYQLMEFHTTDTDSCWWKAHPNCAGRNSISVTYISAKY